ncbi:hypothetical protein IJT17_05885 [bacterium]|nr:hypothetical protein [bacterium]
MTQRTIIEELNYQFSSSIILNIAFRLGAKYERDYTADNQGGGIAEAMNALRIPEEERQKYIDALAKQ